MSFQPLMIKAICTRCGRTSLVRIEIHNMKLPQCLICWQKMESIKSATFIDKLSNPLQWLLAKASPFAKNGNKIDKD